MCSDENAYLPKEEQMEALDWRGIKDLKLDRSKEGEKSEQSLIFFDKIKN